MKEFFPKRFQTLSWSIFSQLALALNSFVVWKLVKKNTLIELLAIIFQSRSTMFWKGNFRCSSRMKILFDSLRKSSLSIENNLSIFPNLLSSVRLAIPWLSLSFLKLLLYKLFLFRKLSNFKTFKDSGFSEDW